jgi:biotin synthase-like enzyme
MTDLTAPALVAQALHFHAPHKSTPARPPSSQLVWTVAEVVNLAPYPESVPINHLVTVAGTPLAEPPDLEPLEFVRTIAVARIPMPRARGQFHFLWQKTPHHRQPRCGRLRGDAVAPGFAHRTPRFPQLKA